MSIFSVVFCLFIISTSLVHGWSLRHGSHSDYNNSKGTLEYNSRDRDNAAYETRQTRSQDCNVFLVTLGSPNATQPSPHSNPTGQTSGRSSATNGNLHDRVRGEKAAKLRDNRNLAAEREDETNVDESLPRRQDSQHSDGKSEVNHSNPTGRTSGRSPATYGPMDDRLLLAKAAKYRDHRDLTVERDNETSVD